MAVVNLLQLPKGKKAKILSVEAKGEMNRRIRDMGLNGLNSWFLGLGCWSCPLA